MKFIKRRIWVVLAIFFIIVYLSPLFILGTDAHVRVHDQLDSAVIWYKILADSGEIFAPNGAEIPNMMNGLPRVSLGTQFKLLLWLFVWFPPFVAYTINAVLVRFVAFFGMYLLLSRHVIRNRHVFSDKESDLNEQKNKTIYKKDTFIEAGVAVCFALLPFWLPGCLSISGIPLAAYAFLNLRKREARIKDWLIIILLPFASSFILTFIFFLAAMGILWLIDWVKTKRSNWTMFSAIALMTAIYLAKDYRLVLSMLLGHGFTPHRVEFNLGHNPFFDTLRLFVENFTTAHTHSYTLQYYIIIYVAGFFFFTVLWKKFRRRGQASVSLHENERKLVRLLILTASFSMWYAFWYWEGMRVLKNAFEVANEFNFSRIHFLNAVLWYLIFAVSLKLLLSKSGRIGKPVVLTLLAIQLAIALSYNHEPKYRNLGMPSWREFYSPKLYADIRDYIGKDPSTYRVASIGMHPAISQYNGFYTLDLYVTLYPLEYKHKFRRIIAPELAANETLEDYFDEWGSRCYLFVDGLGKHYFFTKEKHKVIDNLELNTKAFKQMGGDYILSAVKIANAKENHLNLMHIFENNVSVWRIYLYKVGG
ncbi:MAG TPA: DUF6044 family protein [Bacillales bacterium]|nr:DUF6044 family protein [Bacillales bacterium]